MNEEASQEVIAFCEQLVRLNGVMKALFDSGNVELIGEMNKAVKEMHRIQHGSEDKVLQAVDPECRIIYGNFDMIIAVLRTTEEGVIDAGAQTALNKFLHNIDESVINIAAALGIV